MFEQCRLVNRRSTDTILFGFATFQTAQQAIELAFQLASALEPAGVTQIQSNRSSVQAFAILHTLAYLANTYFLSSQESNLRNPQ